MGHQGHLGQGPALDVGPRDAFAFCAPMPDIQVLRKYPLGHAGEPCKDGSASKTHRAGSHVRNI